MGALMTKVLRPIKNFNVENRAHRVISKEKPEVAPKYPSNIEDLGRAMELEPDLDQKLSRKDEALHERLRSVYVTSTGRPEDDVTRKKDSGKPLPQDRQLVEDFEYGLKEPDHIPYGRTTIRNALNFIASHQADPKEYTASKIAFEHKLKVDHVEDVLKYFKTFEIFIPGDKDTPPKFAGPAHFRKLTEQRIAELEAAEKEAQQKSEPQTIKIKNELVCGPHDARDVGRRGVAGRAAGRARAAAHRLGALRPVHVRHAGRHAQQRQVSTKNAREHATGSSETSETGTTASYTFWKQQRSKIAVAALWD